MKTTLSCTIALWLMFGLSLATPGCGESDQPNGTASPDSEARQPQPAAVQPNGTSDQAATTTPSPTDSATVKPAATPPRTVANDEPGEPAAPTEPIAVAPKLLDYRMSLAPAESTQVIVTCAVAGRLELLDGERLLDSDTAEKPEAACRVARSSSGTMRCLCVRFEPADGSPGTQRILRITKGEPRVTVRLTPPAGEKSWVLTPISDDADG